jgi:hypothetical protein
MRLISGATPIAQHTTTIQEADSERAFLVKYAGDLMLAFIVKAHQITEINFCIGAENNQEDSLHSFPGPLDHGMNPIRLLLTPIHHRDQAYSQALHPLDPSLEHRLSKNWPCWGPQA